MGLFDSTPKRLITGPTLTVPPSRAGEVADLIKVYDPGVRMKGDRFGFDNGVLLYGPVDITPELAEKTGLAAGDIAYYARASALPKREERPDELKLVDGEWLVRGLAARLPGAKHSRQPWAEIDLDLSVWAEQPVPAEPVMSLLQPFLGDEDGRQLFVEDHETVPGCYFLVSELEPLFITSFVPSRLSRSNIFPPPLAIGSLRTKEPCRWQLLGMHDAADADAETRMRLSTAALALADAVNGVVTDMFGFPINRPEDLING